MQTFASKLDGGSKPGGQMFRKTEVIRQSWIRGGNVLSNHRGLVYSKQRDELIT